jgi:hypothetical protein
MNEESNCRCVVCQVEQSLLDSLSTQTARTHFQALARNYPILNHFDSPAEVIARLHEHEEVEVVNHIAWNGILHALVASIADGTAEEIGQQLLLVAYAPAIHKTCHDISLRFPLLVPEDIAQQASLLFLQTARLPMMLRQDGHLEVALVRNFRKEMLRWAMRESRSSSMVQSGPGDFGLEPLSETRPEPTVLLDKVFKQALRDGVLSPDEYGLLCKFKWEGFEANELVGMNAGNTTNAVQMRLKRIIKRLRRTVVTGQPDEVARPGCSESKNISAEATIFSGSMPISNSKKGFSPELSRPVPQVGSDTAQVAA